MIIDPHVELNENRGTAAKRLAGTAAERSSEDAFSASTMDVRKLMAMIGAFYWFIMTVFIVPTGCVCTLFLFLYPIGLLRYVIRSKINLFNVLEHFVCRMANDHWVAAGQYTGLNVTEYGDDIREISDKRVLLLCNHLGLVDHFCLMTAMWDKNSLPGRYLWVIFNIWKMTPLGAMWLTHGNFFINGGQSRRAAVLDDFREHLRKNFWKYEYGWVVMYPEGSRLFLIRDSEKRFAEKQGIVPFKHCVHPRTGAAHAALQICGKAPEDETRANAGNFPPMEYIVDVTLGYPNGQVVDICKAMVGEWPKDNTNVAVHYRIHKIRSEWNDEEKLKEWLYKRYAEKDQLLDNFYRTGSFEGPARPVTFPLWRSLMSQCFWGGIFYIQYRLWMLPLAQFLSDSFWSLFL